MQCQHQNICSGCPWIGSTSEEQSERKKHDFWAAWDQEKLPRPAQSDFVLVAESELRDRVDLVFENNLLSLYQKESRTTFDMQHCPMMSKNLQAWFEKFLEFKFPIKKGSVRLRVSPSNDRGVWLDFANEDIKNLFAEQNLLKSLLEVCYVEIGQRRKKLSFDGERLRLTDPEYHVWTETEVMSAKIPLYSLVASFSQTGHLANQRMVQEIESFANLSPSSNWVEFGAGSGNLTFPLSAGKRKVQALEFDKLSLTGLEKTLEHSPQYKKLISLKIGDFQRKNSVEFKNFDGILVNPPRSGLVKFMDPLNELTKSERPKSFIYMSCYKESFIHDSLKLISLGYQPQRITLIDQFPQSPHCEILSYWELN